MCTLCSSVGGGLPVREFTRWPCATHKPERNKFRNSSCPLLLLARSSRRGKTSWEEMIISMVSLLYCSKNGWKKKKTQGLDTGRNLHREKSGFSTGYMSGHNTCPGTKKGPVRSGSFFFSMAHIDIHKRQQIESRGGVWMFYFGPPLSFFFSFTLRCKNSDEQGPWSRRKMNHPHIYIYMYSESCYLFVVMHFFSFVLCLRKEKKWTAGIVKKMSALLLSLCSSLIPSLWVMLNMKLISSIDFFLFSNYNFFLF